MKRLGLRLTLSGHCGSLLHHVKETPTAHRTLVLGSLVYARCIGRSLSSVKQGLLPFLFADAEDERQQYPIVVQSVTAQLQRCAKQAGTSDGAVRIDGQTARTFSQLVDIVCDKLLPEDQDTPADPLWTGRSVYAGTINAFVRRLSSAERHVAHLIRADIDNAETHAIDLDSQQVTVVDLHLLHDRAKRFVVGVPSSGKPLRQRKKRALPSRCSS